MHKYFLYSSVTFSLLLCLSGAGYVSAQTAPSFDNRKIAQPAPITKYFTDVETYAAVNLDPITGVGKLTVSRNNAKLGTVLTDYIITPSTVFLRKYGGFTTLGDLKVNEELAIYAIRNADGSLTAVTVTDNDLWFLETAIANGEITAADTTKNKLTVKDTTTNKNYSVGYTDDTYILKPKAVAGTETDLVVGKAVRIRGIVRKNKTGTEIERANVIWVLP